MTEDMLRATISQKAVLFDPDEREVLLLLQEDGPWELPGGRIGTDEAPETGVRREVYEETGLLVAVDRPIHTAAWRNERGEDRYAVVFRCRADDREVRLSSEHVHWRWIPPEAALEFELANPAYRTALERAIVSRERERLAGRSRRGGTSVSGADDESRSGDGALRSGDDEASPSRDAGETTPPVESDGGRGGDTE